ncbi:MAG: N-acetylmuramoyl-L-alanine amidase [Chlamydiota bacterium]|nr:N-acetylmuramoyl-L-alanine amidase [Chlamydiota bacterium]
MILSTIKKKPDLAMSMINCIKYLICLSIMVLVLSPIFHHNHLSAIEIEQDRFNWSELEPYQHAITRQRFETLLKHVYDRNARIYQYIDINDKRLLVYENSNKNTPPLFTLNFSQDNHEIQKPKYQILSRKIRPTRIFLDPGHIGGDYAVMEERFFQWGPYGTIREGNMNLIVAKRIKKALLSHGFIVEMSKDTLDPVTKEDPHDFINHEKDFYRKSEIYARAVKAKDFDPDLSICIHFNAGGKDTAIEPWTQDNRLLIFIHGCYGPDEIEIPEQSFHLIRKILEGSHDFELFAATVHAQKLKTATKLEPINMKTPSFYWCSVDKNPYLFARNLSANRLYPGPVIYLEPYYQNNKTVYLRLLAGDYQGVRLINGKFYKSIYGEYADAVTEAVLEIFGPSISGQS